MDRRIEFKKLTARQYRAEAAEFRREIAPCISGEQLILEGDNAKIEDLTLRAAELERCAAILERQVQDA
jgi:hypothetical protein